MLAVIRLGNQAHGDSVSNDIGATSRRKVKAGNVRKTLERLEGRRLVASGLGEPASGPVKRFHVTPRGLREVRKLLAAGSLQQFHP